MNYEDFVKNHAGEMLQKLLTEVLGKDAFDIRHDYNDTEQWSVISIHTEDDNEISLRVYGSDKYSLYFGYYDEDDDFHELLQPLTTEEKNTIPKGLQNALEKVLGDERGLRLPGNFLSRS
ncbi:hypothetical protein [Chitinophaga barathri]|uniref:Uncharacterized protein n=1 Tax=Chitinophaga barathri TaxID=1647451 RepID=A0A3N4MHK4_9BACT|nr:hypothetical protein [Chitinophaga barathri]RPD41237.1 hypothetical protein EG028_11200 [Chitinophaga barathri]